MASSLLVVAPSPALHFINDLVAEESDQVLHFTGTESLAVVSGHRRLFLVDDLLQFVACKELQPVVAVQKLQGKIVVVLGDAGESLPVVGYDLDWLIAGRNPLAWHSQ